MKTLQEIYQNYQGPGGDGDKGTAHSYIDLYSEWFESFRSKKINILEVGVAEGKSVKMWKEYFPEGYIYGVDIFDKKHYEEEKIIIYHSDATKKEFLSLIEELTFDIIIDDGSHHLEDQINTGKLLLPLLKDGGIYVIEDIRPENWPNHPDIINNELGNLFEIHDLRSERPQSSESPSDNILMYYKK